MLSYTQQQTVDNFVDKYLLQESWFKELQQSNSWDLLVLAGSHVRADADRKSDIDIFLVLPHTKQIEHDLPPVHVYQWAGLDIEISKVASEKLRNSVVDKRNLYWWHKAKVVRSNDDELKNVLQEASRISQDELTTLLWTLFCLFKINIDENLPRALQLGDVVGARCCFYQNIDYVMEAVLYSSQIFVTSKKRGSCLKKIAPKIYKGLYSCTLNPSFDYRKENKYLEQIMNKVMRDYGFTDSELATWHERNLWRFLHQAC